MTSTFRLLVSAMPEIAAACEKINDPDLRAKAFDVLVAAARDGDTSSPQWGGYTPTTGGYGTGDTSLAGYTPAGSYDPTSTRVDNGLRS